MAETKAKSEPERYLAVYIFELLGLALITEESIFDTRQTIEYFFVLFYFILILFLLMRSVLLGRAYRPTFSQPSR